MVGSSSELSSMTSEMGGGRVVGVKEGGDCKRRRFAAGTSAGLGRLLLAIVVGPGPAAEVVLPMIDSPRVCIVVGPGPASDDPLPYLGGPVGIATDIPIRGRLLRILAPEIRGS
jgi:hypothetical protein